MLAAVVAVARSPSSAIAVVTELQADGPFTQTMLGVTMVTDVVVILLFTAAAKLGETMLDEGETDALAALAHFVGSTMLQLLLSMAHAAVLGVCCLLLLRVPLAPLARRLAVRELALLLLGGYAFALEPLVQRAVRGSGLEGVLRLEPMLACLTAGALVCNRWGQRRAFAALLRRTMPPVLCFFFVTTGGSMRISQLRRTWPTALLLVGARLASLYCGCALGSHCAAAPRIHRTYGWASYVTQAGVSLGLADEVSRLFPRWGPALHGTLVSAIVINQLLGPPMLKVSLRAAGEAGGASLRAAGLATPGKQAEKEALAEAEHMQGSLGMAASLGQKLAEATRVANPAASVAIAAAAEAAACVTAVAVEAASTIELAAAALDEGSGGPAKDTPGRLSRAAGAIRRWANQPEPTIPWYRGRAAAPLSPGHGPAAGD